MLPHALEDKNMSCQGSGAALSTLNKLRIRSFDLLNELTGHQLNSLVPLNVPHNNTIQQQPISVTQTSHRTLQAPC